MSFIWGLMKKKESADENQQKKEEKLYRSAPGIAKMLIANWTI